MAILSGISGAVEKDATDVSTVRSWQVGTGADAATYAASNTKGGTSRVPGNEDWAGSYQAYGAIPALKPGESFVFHGSIDGTNGVNGTARCNQVEITWDIEGALPISHTVSFEANGTALTRGAEAAADVTVPDPPPSKGTKLELWTVSGTPALDVEISDVRTMTLTITRNNPSYVSSSTAGQTGREEGILDFTLSISVYEDDFADLPDENDIRELRLYTDATLYWKLEWAILTELTDLEVDIEGGGLIGATLNYGMVGFTDVAATPTEGSIAAPGAVAWWPL